MDLINPDTPGGKILLMVLAIILFVVVMGAILLAVDRPKRVPGWVIGLAFAGPAVLMIAGGLIYPAILTIIKSFQNRTSTEFVGMDNYITAFTESQFQIVLRNTVLWVILVPLVATVFGLVYAVLVDRTKFEKAAKGLVFLPMAISMVGASIIWKFVYEYKPVQGNIQQTGLLNQFIVWLGGEPQHFLVNEPWNTFFLIVVMIWIQAGFAMTVLSASIKAIPDDIIEAAKLDGLKGWGMFRYIQVPSVRPALVVVITTVMLATLKAFDIVRTMTGGQFNTSIVANEFYTQSFRQNDQGLGSALAVILFLVVIPVIIYNIRQMKKSEEVR
ncbi:carbohydrate ABC transporter permease [Serinibacter salmoneus]|uniref:Carbohydrate ABC transporter membrane protein 1 (CUT1 family) n=1 Tax=Serinibacter salmoneus TaxID=556530 RepID=A0A2A9D3S0_9MICO|nr:sugar ABC transporter permease [Serinibacter salmoneus]PFG20986.1 carbohydrate ABC transporter membrane protein 1 (CUT1 family) [Serinibacter salmoneus]